MKIVRTNTLLINVLLTVTPFIIHLAGGGVDILVNNTIKVTFRRIHESPQITSFELMEVVLTICSISLRLIVIYRMPPSKINGLKTRTFYKEFSEYVEKLSCASGKVIILGDFNIFFGY